MRVLYREKPRVLAIQSDTHSFVVQQVDKNGKAVAVVELQNNDHLKQEGGWKKLIHHECYGCLGMINVNEQIFVAVITRAIRRVASPVDYETVDKINTVEFLALATDQWDHMDVDQPADDDYARPVHPCGDLQKLLSNGSFYYSTDFDLTSLLQNRGISRRKLREKSVVAGENDSHRHHYQQEYMWNRFLMEELLKFKQNLEPYAQAILDESKILTTVIRGFAKTTNVANGTITIISKQSWKRAGTRFNARGIDDDGNVANYVETEFICKTQSSVFAFTQIRGSVPAFWEQDTTLINPKITLTRSIEATQPSFNRHFAGVVQKYGVTHIVNLLSKTKPAEVLVSNRYRRLYENSDRKDEISYTEFDFHAETKQLSGFAGATKILPLLHESSEQFGWFEYDVVNNEVLTRQDGIFRTNCLDCLDRTNLIQQVISQKVFEHVVDARNYRQDFVNRHNTIWADNGDAISQIYTGTNALKSSFSRSGKMNFAGALSDVTKSVSRMYQNTFVDGKRQSTMDILLGYDKSTKKIRIYDPINDYVHEQMQSQTGQFTTYNSINIFTGTFNLNALEPRPNIDLTEWLFPPENSQLPDIYAIGLQEIIELNAGSILNADSSKPERWAKAIQAQLNSQAGAQYILLRSESIASMTLFLFVEKSKVHNVTQVAGGSKKTGLGGITANKGACAVRFEYGLTSFVLLTSHLAAGVSATLERYNDYLTILQGLTFPRNYTVKDHDHVIWFGDLNYRIDMPNENCRQLIEHGAFDELLASDQLNQEIVHKGAFTGFKEGAIKFYPTYKFDKGTSNYDTSEKQRIPSWTDRVMYCSSRGKSADLKQLNYNCVMNITVSDHKPVYATFCSKVEFIDAEKKAELTQHFVDEYKLKHGNDSKSLVDFSDSSSVNTNFTYDAMSELNLLDDDGNVPNLPPRPQMKPTPPPARKPPTGPADIVSGSSTPPPPPARRNTTNGSSTMPIGFSSTPLIPTTRSATPSRTSSPINRNVATPLSPPKTATQPVKPLVPSKPPALAASKIAPKSPTSEPQNKPSPEPAGSTPAASSTAPPPPPPRSVTNAMSMSDWKPLVPK